MASTPLRTLGGCGKVCSTSQTTGPPATSAPTTAYRTTSILFTPSSRPQATTQRQHTDTGTLPPSSSPTISSDQVHEAPRKINPRKAAGPDNIPGRPRRACANKLAHVLTSIFNPSLSLSIVPPCFKTPTIVPLPKKSLPTCMNDKRPGAPTPIIMKFF